MWDDVDRLLDYYGRDVPAEVSILKLHKSRQAYARFRRPVIVEDGGFFLDELGGFPGALAKLATSMLGLEGLIGLAGQTSTRAAHFESSVAYTDGAPGQCLPSLATGFTGSESQRVDPRFRQTREGGCVRLRPW